MKTDTYWDQSYFNTYTYYKNYGIANTIHGIKQDEN